MNKYIGFLCLAFLMSTHCFCQKNNEQNNAKKSNQITFKVDGVKPATKPLLEGKLLPLLEKKLKRKIKFVPTQYKDATIVPSTYNGFIETVQNCYNDHRPLILTPDAIWLCITQGLSIHINQNYSKYKNHIFRDTEEGKIDLTIREDSLISKKDYWTKAINKMSLLANNEVKDDYHNFFVHRFSTSDSITKTVMEITMLDAFKQKFIYTFESGCGIPKITIKGSKQDWQWILDNLQMLETFNLAEWKNELEVIIEQFIQASEGNIDTAFWKDIYKNSEEYNAHYISGWIIKFFPYLEDTEIINWDDTTNHHSMEDPIKIIYKTNPYTKVNNYLKSTLSTDDFPSGISNVKLTWMNYFKHTKEDLELFGGFLGIKQHKDMSLEPFVCWALANYSDTSFKPKHRSFIGLTHDKDYWSPNFAKAVTDSAVLKNKKYNTTTKSINYVKNVIIKKLESEKQFADTSYKEKAIIFEVLSNGTLGSVYAVDTAVYNTFSYQNEISRYTNSLSVYIKSTLETINEKWYPALAHPVDVLEILDAPVNLSKIKVKVNSYIKIIL